MRIRLSVAAALVLLPGAAALADTVEVSSTTFIVAGRQPRSGSGSSVSLSDTAPVYEVLSLSAREVKNPVAEDLRLVVSAWGAYDLGTHRRWDAGTDADYQGDLVSAYAEGKLLDRHLLLRMGRTSVSAGASQMIQLDGGEAVVLLPGGLRVSGYAGSPVSQRFSSRSGTKSWNPVGGEVAYGGRVGWTLALPGLAGRGLDVGAFANFVEDGGDPVREEVGADWRVQPFGARNLTVAGMSAYSLPDERLSQASASLTWTARPRLHLTADGRFTAPDLLLARNSILSVFSDSQWYELGGGVEWDATRLVTVGTDYHVRIEPGDDGKDAGHFGHDAAAHVEVAHEATRAGLEATYVDGSDNGAVGGRVYGRQELGRAFVAADVLVDYYRHQVNGNDSSVTGTLSSGVTLGHGFTAAVAAKAGVTPYLDQTFDVMAKLAYNQMYRRTEVR